MLGLILVAAETAGERDQLVEQRDLQRQRQNLKCEAGEGLGR
jgi:hypothetical protein